MEPHLPVDYIYCAALDGVNVPLVIEHDLGVLAKL
jgi:hypothetical protein